VRELRNLSKIRAQRGGGKWASFYEKVSYVGLYITNLDRG
jgi:hypothetical protein